MQMPYDMPIQQENRSRVEINIVHCPEESTFFLENVDNIHDLLISSPRLEYVVTQTDTPKKYEVKYSPNSTRHHVQILYSGQLTPGSPFILAPITEILENPSIKFNHSNKSFILENIYNFDKLKILSTTLTYTVFADKNILTTYHVKYDPKDEVHDVSITYNNKEINNGSFRLIPRRLRNQFESDNAQRRSNQTSVRGDLFRFLIDNLHNFHDHLTNHQHEEEEISESIESENNPLDTQSNNESNIQLNTENSDDPDIDFKEIDNKNENNNESNIQLSPEINDEPPIENAENQAICSHIDDENKEINESNIRLSTGNDDVRAFYPHSSIGSGTIDSNQLVKDNRHHATETLPNGATNQDFKPSDAICSDVNEEVCHTNLQSVTEKESQSQNEIVAENIESENSS